MNFCYSFNVWRNKTVRSDYLCFILMKKIKSITKIQYMARLVIGNCKNGIFIRLENNDVAYAPFGYLQKGTKVLCTLYRKAQIIRMLMYA